MIKGTIFIDGDFPTGKGCKWHCSPSCHPAQIGPEWVYGCTHIAWPQNNKTYGDFCPIVNCNGEINKCEIPVKLLKRVLYGQKARMRNANIKIQKAKEEIFNIEYLINNILKNEK
jgi:hypothetical protein